MFMAAWRNALAHLDSLFARVLLIQLGLVLMLGLVFASLFYLERSATLAATDAASRPAWFAHRVMLAASLLAMLLIGVSWMLTRKLMQPLEKLRLRMQMHTPGHALQAATHRPLLSSSGSPEIAAIENAYADLLARLERQQRELAVLLAGVSHDLRSPLGRIRMAAELLPDSAEVSRLKASMVRNVENADHLIGNFLDYLRSGRLALDDTVDLAAVARTAAARFEQTPNVLSVTAPEQLPWPGLNALLVDRMMANLIDNALKYGRAPVQLSLRVEANGVTLDVQDAGPGIAPEALGRLQEAFTRGDESRSIPGTGLGLTIVREIVARFGGTIAFEAQASGYLVRVRLYLPEAHHAR